MNPTFMETTQQTEQASLDTWALVELFGHQKIVGRVTTMPIGSEAFVRVDVPSFNGQKEYTRMFGPKAIYSINPVTEEVARALLSQSQFRNEPVSRYDLPQIEDRPSHEEKCAMCGERQVNCRCSSSDDEEGDDESMF